MISSTGESNNKTGEDTNTCRQRFKGIETFLRRIAFNLGNSPSQTEVKIISCIPIDVTDLQNKIISLERQLFEVTNSKGSPKQVPQQVHTATIESTPRNTNAVLSCKCSEVKPLGLGDMSIMPSKYGDGSSKTRKSMVSFLFPTISSEGFKQSQPFMAAQNWIEKESIDTSVDGRHKRFFRRCKKKKTIKKKDNHKTQLVYYAQTENSPFTSYGMTTDVPFLGHPKPKVDNVFSKSYLENVIQRHFDPERVVEEFSDTSNFTSPVCRDYHSRVHCPLYESDVCSCCHGHFQDVDRYLCKNQNFIVEPIATHLHKEFNRDIYYDSNLYDVVPVKEKAVKAPKDEKLLIKEPKRAVDIRCWPEIARTKPRPQATAMNRQPNINSKLKNRKPTCHLLNPKDTIKNKMPNHCRENKVDKRIGPTDTSKSFCIDYSEIYPKPMFAAHKPDKAYMEPMRTVFRKNAECLTIDVNPKNLTITRSIQIDINSTETKTEETLNQIKSILQSVLAEVKTNPQVNHLPEVKSKKDAVIQNGPSQSDIRACSSLLHSFTYNDSCNTNPYLATCSRQVPSPLCFTNIPCHRPNCTQNFPLLIQTPGHQKCGCFYKSSSHKSAPAQKQATNTATNTEIDKQESHSGETEKLIKEIYKSIALTMDFQKETSNSDYDEIKSVTNNFTDTSDPNDLRSTIVAMSDAKTGPTMTTFSTTTVRSNYNTSLMGSKPDAGRTQVEHYLDYDSQSTDQDILDPEINNRGKTKVASTISEHYSEELTTDDESEGQGENIETMEDVKDKIEKKGLFKRMLGSVKLFNKHKQREIKGSKKQDVARKVNNEKLESDSDDYQTIYSEKITRPEQHLRRHRYKPNTYATYRPQEKTAQRIKNNRRSPYMEQEYRRQWNEQLMFQGNSERRYSSERPHSFRQSPVYWQNYEARSAMVDHHVPYQATYNPMRNTPVKTTIHKVEQRTSPLNILDRKEAKSKFSWLKKHKLGLSQCGEQWKKFIIEN